MHVIIMYAYMSDDEGVNDSTSSFIYSPLKYYRQTFKKQYIFFKAISK